MDADGFQLMASCEFDTGKKLSVVWRVIAVEDRTTDDLPAGIVHRIIAEHCPGEHDCVLEGTFEGHTISAPGSRRLNARSRTITELRSHATEDHLSVITFTRRRLGGTHVTMTAAFRPTSGVVNIDRLPQARQRWDAELARRRSNLLTAIAAA